MQRVREPVSGEVLGQNYLIERELGRGGFGVVFKARHVDIDRVVAIKVLLATYASRDESAKDRFRREATIAASLSYPNSLKVFDYGETEEGVFYLVMEFVAGEDLTKSIQREGKLSPARAVHITRQVLYALSEAHARGIVHRDIKPDNVMLCPLVYDRDFVKVMDFGIAKMVDAGEAITKAGLTLGTPRYMPVEQLRGARLGPASDLYAVGLVLYEMLVGAPAFRGDSAVDTALAVMGSPSVKVPPEAGVPAALAAIIEKAAAKEAEDRYQSAREMLDALDALSEAIAAHADVTPAAEASAARATSARRATAKAIAKPAGSDGPTGTTIMPEVDRPLRADGDFDDATRTQAVAVHHAPTSEASRASAPQAPPAAYAVDRTAATQALDVSAVTTAAAASATQTALVTSAMARAPSATTPAVAAPKTSDARGASWLGAPPVLLILNVAAVALMLIMLATRHG